MIRLVRAKQATKRKSSLDTLIEVVQKELLRVNGQTNSTSPPASPPPQHYSQTRATTSSKQTPQQTRSMIPNVLPSTHPSSLTSQSHQSFKTSRKRINHHLNNTKRMASNRNRSKSFNNEDLTDDMDLIDEDELYPNHHEQQQNNDTINTSQSSSTVENVEEIVRDTVDRLVAITLLNNAPFIVNMVTGTPGNTANANNETKPLINAPNTNVKDYFRTI